jgi:RNA polymerase sigma factor (sigma-70 family)
MGSRSRPKALIASSTSITTLSSSIYASRGWKQRKPTIWLPQFLRALDKLPTLDPNRARFKTWLFTLVRNTLYNHWRDQAARKSLPIELADRQSSHAPMPEEEAVRQEDHNDLLKALRLLEDREREIIALKFSARLTNRQIAELTGLTDSNIGVILFRTLKRLKMELDAENRHA